MTLSMHSVKKYFGENPNIYFYISQPMCKYLKRVWFKSKFMHDRNNMFKYSGTCLERDRYFPIYLVKSILEEFYDETLFQMTQTFKSYYDEWNAVFAS